MDPVTRPAAGHSAATLLAPDHQELWRRFNDTADPALPAGTVGELLRPRLRAGADRPAVLAARCRLSDRELAARAGPVARRLRAAGRPVVVCLEPGWEQVVAVVAAALAGVPFHPVDPAAGQPARWRRVAELGAGLILTQSWLDERLGWPEHTTRIALDTAPAGEPAAEEPAGAPDQPWCLLAPDRPEGRPVPVSHQLVVDTVLDLARRFDLGESDRVLLVSPLADPATLFAIAGMLLSGGAVVVPDDLDLHTPAVWFDLIRRERVTVWHATPTLSGLLAEHLDGRGEPAPELRLALIGGEPLPPPVADRLRAAAGPALRVANLGPGGPAGLWATCLEVADPAPGEGHVPVGTPLANQRAYVLGDSLAPCPAWVTGRVYLGGRGLPADLPDLVRFPPTGEPLHRTDLTGRLLPDGTLDLVGEDGTAISVHGHPLNLREVEARLAAHPAVLRAAVVPYGTGSAGYVRLVAGTAVTGADLLDELRRQMSPYLLPARIDRVSAFALTRDGRLDRAALASQPAPAGPGTTGPAAAGSGPGGAGAGPGGAGGDSAGPVPAELVDRACRLAATVLGISDVEQHLNLLDLGATSVQLVRLATRAEQELGIEVDIDELLRFPSVSVLVSSARPAPPAPVPGPAGGAPPGPAELILDPVDRIAFKDRQPGLRQDPPPDPAGPPLAYRDLRLGRRRSYRQFDPGPVPADRLPALLGALRQLDPAPDPKYGYPSAGGLYPVQSYLTVAPGRVSGIAGGAYYYHPVAHRLVPLSPDGELPAAAHAWINREPFRASAFALYLVADRAAVEPMYGNRARDYCLIEAGAICQLLMTVAVELDLALCPVGELDATVLRDRLRLADRHELLHTLLGGAPPAFRGARRQPVPAAAPDLVGPVGSGAGPPLLVGPRADVDLAGWAAAHAGVVTGWLDQHGAVLFRGFPVTEAGFPAVARALAGAALPYRERSSPRTELAPGVYTSTDYPADQPIPLHNENSYQRSFPARLVFGCLVPAAQGGETPLADCRRVLARIDPQVVAEFHRRQVRYRRHYSLGAGMTWQEAFQEADPDRVEAYCREQGIAVRWEAGGTLRTEQVGPALAGHPRTREPVWFNHAAFFHVSGLPPAVRAALLSQFGADGLPVNAYFGDGAPIDDRRLAGIRAAYAAETVPVRWQRGDVLLVDNLLVAHGRAPFAGPRRVVVSMGGALRHADLPAVGSGAW